MQQQAVLAMSLQEQLILSDDESDEEGEDEACGGKLDEVYDDGELKIILDVIQTAALFDNSPCRLNSTNARNLHE
jgi:hypothetical protein